MNFLLFMGFLKFGLALIAMTPFGLQLVSVTGINLSVLGNPEFQLVPGLKRASFFTFWYEFWGVIATNLKSAVVFWSRKNWVSAEI